MPAQTALDVSQLIRKKPDGSAADEADADEGSAERASPDAQHAVDGDNAEPNSQPAQANRRVRWKSVVSYGLLPALTLMLAMAAGYLKFVDGSSRDSHLARTQSVQAATEGTIAILSYHSNTVENDLAAAQDRLTGTFRDSYASLTHDVVIPGAKQKQISAQARVPAAASVSANARHAEVLVFVNQTITIGNDAPSDTASSVRVTLDNINGRWLISSFDPI